MGKRESRGWEKHPRFWRKSAESGQNWKGGNRFDPWRGTKRFFEEKSVVVGKCSVGRPLLSQTPSAGKVFSFLSFSFPLTRVVVLPVKEYGFCQISWAFRIPTWLFFFVKIHSGDYKRVPFFSNMVFCNFLSLLCCVLFCERVCVVGRRNNFYCSGPLSFQFFYPPSLHTPSFPVVELAFFCVD